MLTGWFMWFILIWVVFLFTLFAIGGFFMFRKFFKLFPKADGMSEMDWQEYYIGQTKHLWTDEMKELLEELVKPVPKMFRDVARDKIAGKIGQLALEEKAETITQDLIIRGYVMATPKQDQKFLIKFLTRKGIDVKLYEHLLQ